VSDNLFFDRAQLARCGSNVIIGKTVRIRYPELVEIADDVIIDDFTYVSTALRIASNVHIAAGCKLIGGRHACVSFDRFSTLAPGVVLAAGSDDYTGGIATPLVDAEFKGAVEVGEIHIARHSIVGANSVVTPNVTFGEGAALGALSLAKQDLEAWTLYAGVPARPIKPRDRAVIEKLEARFLEKHRG
jgi:acetyltransferase-like isoleucine patch superfamily enzyme